MREGSLDAPTRHPIDWQNPDFLDAEKLDAELRRQFDVCHGCRRCFNLCDSFPRLFDLVDDQEDELDGVDSANFKSVVDACTLCDMCFLTKCPYVPPHEFNIDFPHLMLRYRAAEKANNGIPFFDKQLTETDRNGKLAGSVSGVANWGSKRGNSLTRPLLEAVAGVLEDELELIVFAGCVAHPLLDALGELDQRGAAVGGVFAELLNSLLHLFYRSRVELLETNYCGVAGATLLAFCQEVPVDLARAEENALYVLWLKPLLVIDKRQEATRGEVFD